ncbi:MAG: hypothetical protein H6807_11800 [Planctomycetes bacterium]|nr:hypothetical protein [Planctomycetota bacterium]
MSHRHHSLAPFIAALLLVLSACSGGGNGNGNMNQAEAADPAEVAIGERLFLETRFAQFFMANSGGDANAQLLAGDPALDFSETMGAPLPGPFASASMNCSACHLVDQQLGMTGGGMRTYGDFARRSPIPARADGQTLTPRNSPPLVGASVGRENALILHLDGEFADPEDLVRATLTGRNYGWLPNEAAQAMAQVATIIRADDGQGDLAAEFGGLSYATVLDVDSVGLPEEFDLPLQYRIDVDTATDQQILDAVARLIAVYIGQLEFAADQNGAFTASPYDRFLQLNGLPTMPDQGESRGDYADRLLGLIEGLGAPVFVPAGAEGFAFHDQDFAFGAMELQGLKLFLTRPDPQAMQQGSLPTNGIGNCVACHHAPEFSDFGFHNVGIAQEDYDAIHGAQAFAQLVIPDLTTRDADPDLWLPASAARPNGMGSFLSVPTPLDAQRTDLGMWNVFANDVVPAPQQALRDILLAQTGLDPNTTTEADLLPLTIATFKTPGLRDLGHGAPYMHTGRFDDLDDVLAHYVAFSALARNGQVRNADPELANIFITPTEAVALIAFLRSLNEDYE